MGKIVGVTRRPVAVGLNPAVIFPDGVRIVVGAVGEVRGPFQGEGVFHMVVETLLVYAPAQHVVSLLLPDLARNRLLVVSPRGCPIKDRDTTLQPQHGQQFRNGRDCVGLVSHCGLVQHQANRLAQNPHPQSWDPRTLWPSTGTT